MALWALLACAIGTTAPVDGRASPGLSLANSPFATGKTPGSVAFSRSGELLATANRSEGQGCCSGSVSVFSVLAGGQLAAPGLTAMPGEIPTAVAFSPTADFLAVAKEFDTAEIQSVVTLYSVSNSSGLTATSSARGDSYVYATALAFRRDGKLVATANASQYGDQDHGTISMFAVSAAGALTPVGAPTQTGRDPTSIAFSPDGRLLVTTNATGNTISMFSVASGGALTAIGAPSLTGHGPRGLAFSPDGKLLATVNAVDSSISTFAVGQGGTLTAVGPTISAGPDPRSVAFSPDGTLLATANFGGDSVSMFSVAPSGLLSAVGPRYRTADGPLSIAFSPTGDMVATSNFGDSSASMFSVSAGGALGGVGTPTLTDQSPRAVAINRAGLLATASIVDHLYGAISIFSQSAGGGLTKVGSAGSYEYKESAAFNPAGDLLATADGVWDSVSVYSVSATGQAARVGMGNVSGPVSAAVFSPDGKLLAAADDTNSRVALFSVSAMGALIALNTLGDGTGLTGSHPNSVAFSPDGRLLAAANADGDSVSMFSLSPGGAMTPIGLPMPAGDGPVELAFSPDGRFLAVANNVSSSVSVFSVAADGTLTAAGLDTPTGTHPRSLAISPDGRLLATSSTDDDSLSLFLLTGDGSLSPVGARTATGHDPVAIAFSPDGKWLATANVSDDSVSVFSLAAPALDTSITSEGPPPATSATTAEFAFDANYPSTFECRLDDAPFEPCSSRVSYFDLAEGEHEFEVRARDLVGNLPDLPTIRTWMVDRSGPAVVSLAEPGEGARAVRDTVALAWSPTTDELTRVDHYELWIDGTLRRTLPPTACGALCTAVPDDPLADGPHRWQVRAIDEVGNMSASQTRTFTVDALPPSAFALDAPPDGAVLSSLRPALSWRRADDAGVGVAGYDVRIDGQLVATMDASQTTYTPGANLDGGPHEWQVVARDAYEYERASETRSFSVDVTPPVAVLDASPAHFVVPFMVRLDAGASHDPGGGPIVSWHFDVDGDGVYETASDRPALDRVFTEPGTRTVGVRVTDQAGLTATARADIEGEAARQNGIASASYVTIDDGADYTRDLLVGLEINPPARRGATTMVVSNDGRPDEVHSRLPISQHIRGWRLAAGDGARDRRTVYVFFYNAAGTQVGERVQDDIRYDPIPPTLTSVTVRRTAPKRAQLRLRARDSGSGLGRLDVYRGPRLIARRGQFRRRISIPLTRTQARIRVTLFDRAGNKTTKIARSTRRASRR